MPEPAFTLNPALLRHVSLCHRRVWLDTYESGIDQENSPVSVMSALHHSGRSHYLETVEVNSWSEAVAQTRAWLDAGHHIIGAALETTLKIHGERIRLRGKVDRLLRVSSGIGQHVYRPVCIKGFARPDLLDLLNMDLAIFLLQQMDVAIAPGMFWLDIDESGRPAQEIMHRYDEDRFRNSLMQALNILNLPEAPPVKLEKHCKSCPWFADCGEKADRLAMLPGLRKDSLLVLQQSGITTLEAFVALSVDHLRTIRGIKSSAAGLHAGASALLHNAPVWLKKTPELLERGGWMFDIETLQMPGGSVVPWCIGFGNEAGESQVVVVASHVPSQNLPLPDGYTAQLVPDVASLWRAFYETVKHDNKLLVHWSGYDAGILKGTAPQPVVDALLPRTHDLLATVKDIVRLPVYSYSIKDVAPALGFNWSGYEDWFAAYMDYQHWLRTQNAASLAQACAYQRDDVLALAVVWRWLAQNRGHDSVV